MTPPRGVSTRPVPILPGTRLTLRPLEAGDLPQTLLWRNANRAWFIDDSVISEPEHHAWFARYTTDAADAMFIITEHQHPGRPIGQVGLYRIDHDAARAECGRLILGDLAARGRGLATEAIGLVTTWGLTTLGLSEIVANIFDHNRASLRSFERAGFIVHAQQGRLITLVARADSPLGHARR